MTKHFITPTFPPPSTRLSSSPARGRHYVVPLQQSAGNYQVQQLIEIRNPLVVTDLCHLHVLMALLNNGISGYERGNNHICFFPVNPSFQYSILPILLGRRPVFYVFLKRSFIRWIWPLPNPFTSQPSSKNLSIFLSSRIPKQSTTARGSPAMLTISSGSSSR